MSFGKNDIYDLLNTKSIPFTCTEHRPVYSMEELDVMEIPANAVICKNLFLRNSNGKQHFLLTVPAATPTLSSWQQNLRAPASASLRQSVWKNISDCSQA